MGSVVRQLLGRRWRLVVGGRLRPRLVVWLGRARPIPEAGRKTPGPMAGPMALGTARGRGRRGGFGTRPALCQTPAPDHQPPTRAGYHPAIPLRRCGGRPLHYRPRLRAPAPRGLLGGRPGVQGPRPEGPPVGGASRGLHPRLPQRCRRSGPRRRPERRGHGGVVCGPAMPGLLPYRPGGGSPRQPRAAIRGVRRLHGRASRRPQVPLLRLPLRERRDERRGGQGVV